MRVAEVIQPSFWYSIIAGNRLRILMYHSVADNPRDPHALPPEQFASQMAWLARHAKAVIPLADGVRRLQKRLPLRGYWVITFDDAYCDFLRILPLLQKHGFPATLFVPAGLVGGTAVWDSYDKTKQLMTWDDLRQAQACGVTIASHTLTHARLPELSDAEMEHELVASLALLRAELGEVYPALSYPGGFAGERERRAAQRAGYVCAVGVASRWGNGLETDLYALRRERLRCT